MQLALLHHEAAKLASPNGPTSSTCGYAYPSIEYFADEYLANTVGFNSSYPDAEVVRGWVHKSLAEAADYIGPEGMLHLQALLDSLIQEGNRIFQHYDALYGGDWDKACQHEDEWDLTNEANIADACDMVRAALAA